MQYSADYDSRFDPAMPMVELTISSSNPNTTIIRSALVDSGADATLISQADLQRLGADLIGWGRMVGVSGISQRVPIYAVQLSIGQIDLGTVRVLGYRTTDNPIVGRNVLNQLIVTLNGLAQVTEISQ
ncbi:MAG: retroviral-like aspartic protease family protein [Anaerolineales bacterium]|nr:retroviral-like aspartic protease family protein [Anaerolineales bacterium]